MADAAVDSLIEYLHRVQKHHADLFSHVIDLVNVDELVKDLCNFKAFLADYRRLAADGAPQVVRDIRYLVYEVEDFIRAIMTKAADADTEYYFLRDLPTPEKLTSIRRQVNSIFTAIREIHGDTTRVDFTDHNIRKEQPKSPKAVIDKQVNVVGIEDEADKLIKNITKETTKLDILAVIGVAGLGKTTLAWKVFGASAIKYKFPTRIWIYVSQQFTKKDVFLSILKEFMKLTEDVYGKSDEDLAALVASHLEIRKFLVVMDDVWEPADWEKLRIAFPESNKMGKVLITSRFEKVARFANPDGDAHMLRFLEPHESWKLFQQEVFGNSECPPEMKVVGQVIAGQCHRLPLAIMVVAGMLVEIFSSSETKSRAETWWEVSKILGAHSEKKPVEFLSEAISLSYDKLSYHLRYCFIYLAILPEDYEIPVQKLIYMWIAEGLIQQKAGNGLEEIAESYLEDLIIRNLVKIDKINSRGKVKTCRIHDMIRDLCKKEAGETENFLQEITKCSLDGDFKTRVQNYYRLCVHSDIDTLDFLSSKPHGPRVRSFVCFSRDEINLPPRYISAIPLALKMLRVLEAKPIKFTKVPRSFYHLIHLKYITISFTLSILPAAFSKFWDLQTLIVNTTSYSLEVKLDILKLTQLRHFKTNASATLPTNGSTEKSEKLQTLGTVSPQSCTEEVFNRAPNLKKLGIRGQLVSLLSGENASFGSLKKLLNLKKLKLLNGVSHDIGEVQLPRLPPASDFPPKLRTLTLSNTFLEWSHIPTLGSLENLEVLKLEDYAFVGKHWEAANGGFRKLKDLHIGCTDLINWSASSHHFPMLRCLELRNCEELREVPIAFADIASFQILDLYRTATAAASAKEVQKVKEKQETSAANVFKLSIFPPLE